MFPLLTTRILALFAATAIAVVAAPPAGAKPKKPAQEEVVKAPVLMSVTSGKEDLHSVTMALQLANHALEDGRDVTIFFSVRGPEMARADLSEAVVFRDNAPIATMLAELIGKGAKVYVCPHCMAVLGIAEEDLAEGVAVASREAVFGPIDAGGSVFSF